ncbi:MAG: polysaccharide biosynthesis tyrosine autokinase [Phormidium sp.]
MDRNYQSQPFSTKRNGKQIQPLSEFYINQSENSDEEKVVKDLNKLFAAARRRAIVIVAVAISVSVGATLLLSKRAPTYQGKFQVLVEPVTTAENKLLSVVTQTLGVTSNKTDATLDYDSQIQVLLSPKLINPIVDRLKQRYSDITYDTLIGSLTITRFSNKDIQTKILEITYGDKDPAKVEFILQEVSQAYLKYSLEDRQAYLSQGLEFIENQIPQMQRQVDILTKQLQTLRQKFNLVDPAIQDKYLTEQINGIVQQRVENQMKLAEIRSLYTILQKLYDQGNIIGVLSQDGVSYGPIIRQINDLEGQIAETSARFREESKTMQVLRQQQKDVQMRARKQAENILEKAKSQVQALEARQEIIAQTESTIRQRISELPAITRQSNNLQSQLQVANDTLNQLLTKRDKLRIDVAQQEVPWQLIASPELPRDENGKLIKPKLNKKNLIVIVVLALVIAIGVAFLIEILNNVFHSPEEVEEETKLPLLAVIPFAKEIKKLGNKRRLFAPVTNLTATLRATLTERAGRYLVVDSARQNRGYIDSPIVEAFRSLYMNIRLLSPDKPIQSLVISSATPGDGKSTVAVYLAQTAAAIGQRVLLVDADLRRPKIHDKLHIPNVQGLSDAIATDISLNQVIQKSSIEENLFVLTAGSIPSDPVKHLSSEKMRHLMEQFQAFFDLVIYDTPPLVGLADSHLLAAYTDGVVIVVGLEKTDRFMLKKGLHGLNITGANVLGVVANGIKGFKFKGYKAYQKLDVRF